MKNKIFFLLCLAMTMLSFQIFAQDIDDKTNDFYDNAPTINLPFSGIEITGEVANNIKIDLSTLPLRNVIVKETVLIAKKDTFIGAYRYDGYSLYDILNNVVVKKKLETEFGSMIDVWVEIENNKGEKVVVSWGEIYYPVNRHNIIIATRVARIVPSKTKDLWPLPTESRLIVGSDLLTERNISSPTKITVKSFPKSYPVNKDMPSAFCTVTSIYKNDLKIDSLKKYPSNPFQQLYHTVFYGRGKGIHGIKDFKGVMFKDVLSKYASINKKDIQTMMVAVIAKDGFRCVYTFSELFNRNDYAEVLFIDKSADKKFGIFSVFPAQDYFSDRAVKAIQEIRIFN
ncbi:MAG: hypothetical protein HY951_17950 [Bacteroidia bacterium]|nr:hypothetical protein [Bacteroidia bacterium]